MTEPPSTTSSLLDRVRTIGADVSNWGRWGATDELGTVNLISPESRVAAAGLVRTGEILRLGLPFGANGPQVAGRSRRFNPIHQMLVLPTDGASATGQVIADDMIVAPLQAGTQWDSLAHVGYDDRLYNDVPLTAVTASRGAVKNAVDRVVPHLVGRGVLLDIARLHGVETLGAGVAISATDLDAAEAAQGVELRRGDIVLIRTGWIQTHHSATDERRYIDDRTPGLDLSCATWFHHYGIGATASDSPFFEVRPGPEVHTELPVHMVLIRDMGMTLGEMFDLEQLAARCAEHGRWEFFFSGVGLEVSGAVGTPVSPVVLW